jgi:hypothetical protein
VLATRAGDDRGDQEQEWPLDDLREISEPASLADRCLVVDGDDLDELYPLAKRSSFSTSWGSGDESWRLVFRPLLPGERTCADIDAS